MIPSFSPGDAFDSGFDSFDNFDDFDKVAVYTDKEGFKLETHVKGFDVEEGICLNEGIMFKAYYSREKYKKMKARIEGLIPLKNEPDLAVPLKHREYKRKKPEDIHVDISHIPLLRFGLRTIPGAYEMIRIFVEEEDTCHDFYCQDPFIYEVGKETQELFESWFPQPIQRQIVSFLSPCASESCYIWTNKSSRWDADNTSTYGHVRGNIEVKSILRRDILKIDCVIDSLETLCNRFNDLRDWAKLTELKKRKQKRVAMIEAINSRATNFKVPSVTRFCPSPCFGMRTYLQEVALKYNIQPENYVYTFMIRNKSAISRTKLNTSLTRGQLNFMYYASYVYKKEKEMSFGAKIEKYPKYERDLKGLIPLAEKRDKILDQISEGIKYYLRKCPTSSDNKNYISSYLNDDNYDPDDKKGYIKKLENRIKFRRAKEVQLKDEYISDAFVKAKSFINNNTILILPDGKRVYAKNHINRRTKKKANMQIGHYISLTKRLIRIIDKGFEWELKEFDHLVEYHKKSRRKSLLNQMKISNIFIKFKNRADRQAEIDYKAAVLRIIEEEQRAKFVRLMNDVIESYNFKNSKTGLFDEEEEGDY